MSWDITTNTTSDGNVISHYPPTAYDMFYHKNWVTTDKEQLKTLVALSRPLLEKMLRFGLAIFSSVHETTLSVLHSSAQSDNYPSHWSDCVEISTNEIIVLPIKQITLGCTSQSKVNNTTAYFLSARGRPSDWCVLHLQNSSPRTPREWKCECLFLQRHMILVANQFMSNWTYRW